MSTQLLSLSLWLTECGFAITFVVDEDGNAGRFELYERNGKDIPAAYVVSGLSGLNSWPTHTFTRHSEHLKARIYLSAHCLQCYNRPRHASGVSSLWTHWTQQLTDTHIYTLLRTSLSIAICDGIYLSPHCLQSYNRPRHGSSETSFWTQQLSNTIHCILL